MDLIANIDSEIMTIEEKLCLQPNDNPSLVRLYNSRSEDLRSQRESQPTLN